RPAIHVFSRQVQDVGGPPSRTMTMGEATLSILFHGLAYAMILYIISVGLSVTMGLMGFVNLAHGVFAMAGGYVTVTLMNTYAVPFGLALLIAFVVVALISVILERTLYAR